MPPQRVGIRVEDTDLDGVLHLPDANAIGGAAVLHGYGGGPDQPHIVATCEALAKAGIAALRFAFRSHRPPKMTLASALADAAGAVRVLKAHPSVPDRLGVVGFSYGGTVAALVAGRDSRVRAAVLAAAPAEIGTDPKWKPVAELSRTRARVLLVWGSRDTEVPIENAERYAAVLSQARVPNRIVTIDGADHDFAPAGPRAKMTETIADWMRERLA
ncbi:MAG: prolyl oligopeptidase family serine peptidase [Chloroflexota bacterium]|nr:prolyl oligopeptidase family serine peptidase [Chloroflexota bacterium]